MLDPECDGILVPNNVSRLSVFSTSLIYHQSVRPTPLSYFHSRTFPAHPQPSYALIPYTRTFFLVTPITPRSFLDSVSWVSTRPITYRHLVSRPPLLGTSKRPLCPPIQKSVSSNLEQPTARRVREANFFVVIFPLLSFSF